LSFDADIFTFLGLATDLALLKKLGNFFPQTSAHPTFELS
jgi:hypothetical protein